MIDLAEKLLEIAPVPMSKIWFANSGSKSNDSAARIIWYYWHAMGKPEKRKIIAHQRAYHGNTIASASLTVGAFFTEPIMGSGGVIVSPPTYYEKIQAVLKKHDLLLVSDEVITAFGRTGNMFGTTTMGLKPDMIVCAKELSSAYIPISALMVNARVFDAISEESDRVGVFGLSFTYSGHPVSAAVAHETLRIYEEEDIVGHVRAMEPHFQGGLRELLDHPLVGEVRGKGLVAGVELVKDKATGEAFNPALSVGPYCNQRAEDHGLIVRAIGDMISFCPPLIINRDEIEEMLARFRLALDNTLEMVREQGLI